MLGNARKVPTPTSNHSAISYKSTTSRAVEKHHDSLIHVFHFRFIVCDTEVPISSFLCSGQNCSQERQAQGEGKEQSQAACVTEVIAASSNHMILLSSFISISFQRSTQNPHEM